MNKRLALWPVNIDSNVNDNTAYDTAPNLKGIINKKLAALDLSGYSAKMIGWI
jgi:hypothetical protein